MRSQGLVEERGDRVHLSPAGQALVGEPPPPMAGIELLAFWQAKLPGKAKKMLGEIWAVGPRAAITREALAEAVGMESRGGGFANYLGALRSNGLVEDGPEGLTAAEVFFR